MDDMSFEEKYDCSEKAISLAHAIAGVLEAEKYGYTIVMTTITMVLAGLIDSSRDPEDERKTIFAHLEPSVMELIAKVHEIHDGTITPPTEH